MAHVTHIKDPIYRMDLTVVQGTLPDRTKHLRELGVEAPEHPCWASMTCIPSKSHILLWFDAELPPGAEGAGMIAHECLHATVAVLGLVGMPIKVETDEAACYYLQWLVGTVTETLRPKKKRKAA